MASDEQLSILKPEVNYTAIQAGILAEVVENRVILKDGGDEKGDDGEQGW